MKRIFLVVPLLLFLLSGTALAAPFHFGPSYFDDQDSVQVNVNRLVTQVGSAAWMVPFASLSMSGDTIVKVTALGVSTFGFDQIFSLVYGNNLAVPTGGMTAVQTSDPAALRSFFLEFEGGSSPVANQEYFWVFGSNVDWLPEGAAPFVIPAGAYLFGFALPDSGNVVDGFFMLQAAALTPIPGAIWLLGSGLAGLAVLRGKKRLG